MSDFGKALTILLMAVVTVGVIDPVLIWLVLNVPPESLHVELTTVYVWWTALLVTVFNAWGFLSLLVDRDKRPIKLVRVDK